MKKDFQKMSFLSASGERKVKSEYQDRCPYSVQFGLIGLSHLEVQIHGDEYWYTYWNPEGEVVQSRQLSAAEVEYLPHADTHIESYFMSIVKGLRASGVVFEKISQDAVSAMKAIQRVIRLHDANLRRIRRFIPIAKEDPHMRGLRWIEARLWDFVEMSEVGKALSQETEQVIPRFSKEKSVL